MRRRDLRTLRREKLAQQEPRRAQEEQEAMDQAFEQLAREREQKHADQLARSASSG